MELAVKLLVPSAVADSWETESVNMFGVQKVQLCTGQACPLRFAMIPPTPSVKGVGSEVVKEVGSEVEKTAKPDSRPAHY